MIIYVTRHGQTDWNLIDRLQGITDNELNDEGIKQARKKQEDLKNENIDLIICSTLKRARQTAEIINDGREIQIIYDEDIQERNYGEFEGLKNEDCNLRDFWDYEKNLEYPVAESVRQFFDRVYSFLDRIKKEYADKKILIVAHAGVSIAIDCYFNGISDASGLLEMALDNCEVRKFEIKGGASGKV